MKFSWISSLNDTTFFYVCIKLLLNYLIKQLLLVVFFSINTIIKIPLKYNIRSPHPKFGLGEYYTSRLAKSLYLRKKQHYLYNIYPVQTSERDRYMYVERISVYKWSNFYLRAILEDCSAAATMYQRDETKLKRISNKGCDTRWSKECLSRLRNR